MLFGVPIDEARVPPWPLFQVPPPCSSPARPLRRRAGGMCTRQHCEYFHSTLCVPHDSVLTATFNAAAQQAASAKGLPCLALLVFCTEGDNVPEAVDMTFMADKLLGVLPPGAWTDRLLLTWRAFFILLSLTRACHLPPICSRCSCGGDEGARLCWPAADARVMEDDSVR